MGFVVDAENRLVTVDHSHNHFCITTPEGNPVELMLGTLKVTSIFARTKGKRDKRDPGDNSPMLYVIKGLHELRTNPRAREGYRGVNCSGCQMRKKRQKALFSVVVGRAGFEPATN